MNPRRHRPHPTIAAADESLVRAGYNRMEATVINHHGQTMSDISERVRKIVVEYLGVSPEE